MSARKICILRSAASRLGIGCYELVQNPFNLLARDDPELLEICIERDIAYVAYSPLAAGTLRLASIAVMSGLPRAHNWRLRPDGYDLLLTATVHDAIDQLGDEAALVRCLVRWAGAGLGSPATPP